MILGNINPYGRITSTFNIEDSCGKITDGSKRSFSNSTSPTSRLYKLDYTFYKENHNNLICMCPSELLYGEFQ